MKFNVLIALVGAASAIRISQKEMTNLAEVFSMDAPKTADEAIRRCDSNGDQSLTKQEVIACAKADGAPQQAIDSINSHWPKQNGQDVVLSKSDLEALFSVQRSLAQAPPKNAEEAIKRCDGNGDNSISKDELLACAKADGAPQQALDSINTHWPKQNGQDVVLSKSDIEALFRGGQLIQLAREPRNAEEAIKMCDGNGDSQLTKDEVVACAKADGAPQQAVDNISSHWPQRDGKDMVLSKADLERVFAMQQLAQGEPKSAAEAIKMCDANGDQKLSKGEVIACARENGASEKDITILEDHWPRDQNGRDVELTKGHLKQIIGQ